MGIADQRSGRTSGGISPVFSQGDDRKDRGEDDGRTIQVPNEFRAQALIYPVIKNKILPFQGLADGSIDVDTFVKAQKMAKFYNYVEDAIEEKTKKKEDVEYFD